VAGGAGRCALADVRPAGALAADRRLLVQQLLDPAQRAAQGLRIGPGPAHLKRRFKLGSDGIRYHLQRFGCISLRSAALHCVPGTLYQPKCSGFRNWSTVKRILF
jgi:hypothetical protein